MVGIRIEISRAVEWIQAQEVGLDVHGHYREVHESSKVGHVGYQNDQHDIPRQMHHINEMY